MAGGISGICSLLILNPMDYAMFIYSI